MRTAGKVLLTFAAMFVLGLPQACAQEIKESTGTLREWLRPTAIRDSGDPCSAAASRRKSFSQVSNAWDTDMNSSADSGLVGGSTCSVAFASTATYHTFQAPAHGVLQSWLVVSSSATNTQTGGCYPGTVGYNVLYSTVSETGPWKTLASRADSDYSLAVDSVSIPNDSSTAWVRTYVCTYGGGQGECFDPPGICDPCDSICSGDGGPCGGCGTNRGRMWVPDVRIERVFATGAKKAAPFSD